MRTRKDDFSLKAIKTEQAENGAVDADTASSVPAVEDASVVQVEEASVEELRKLALEKGKRIVLLCCLAGGISALDRQAMSVAIVPMAQELSYSASLKGSVSSIFSLGYTLALLPLGLGQQLLSPKILMASGVLSWSALTIFTPEAAYSGTSFLLVTRMAVGAAEAVVVPSVQTFVARWIPRQSRSTYLSLLSSSFSLGTVTALVVAPRVVQAWGWPAVFHSFGLLGAGWVGVWLLTAKDKPAVPVDAAREGEGERKREELHDVREMPWGTLLLNRPVWAATAAHAANNWGLYTTLAWLPSFFVQKYGFDLSTSALYSTLPYLAGMVAAPAAGFSADALIASGMDTTAVRKIMQGVASFGPMACMLALASLSSADHGSPQAASALFVLAVALAGASTAGFGTSLQDLSSRFSGTLYGVVSVVSSIAGATGVYVTGEVLEHTGSWATVFALIAAVYALGGSAFTAVYDATPLFPRDSKFADE